MKFTKNQRKRETLAAALADQFGPSQDTKELREQNREQQKRKQARKGGA